MDDVGSDTAREPGGGPRQGRNLPAAIAVGLLLGGIFLASIFWHPIAFAAVVGILTALAYADAGRLLRGIGIRIEVPVLIVATFVMLFGAYHARHAGQAVGVAVLILGGVLWQLADHHRQDVVRTLAATCLFGLWVGFFASYAILLAARPEGGILAVLGVAGAAIFTDIGGFVFGTTLGKRNVAPSVSPNKTWEGLLGGLLVAVVLAAVVLPLLGDLFTPLTAAVLALACGVASFLGDLVESMLKRDLGVKDLGSLLPGHGGVLDRVDGILFALPVGYYAVELLTRGG